MRVTMHLLGLPVLDLEIVRGREDAAPGPGPAFEGGPGGLFERDVPPAPTGDDDDGEIYGFGVH